MTDAAPCAACGAALPEGAMFCGECGRAVTSVAAPTSSSSATRTDPVERHEMIEPPPRHVARREVPADPLSGLDGDDLSARGSSGVPPQTGSLVNRWVGAIPSAAGTPGEQQPAHDPVGQPPPAGAHEAPAPAEICGQCGATLERGDIFCPECGMVAASIGAGYGRPGDTAVIEPVVRGDSSPLNEAAVARNESDPDDIRAADDATRIVLARGRGERFILQFSTGESISTEGSGLVGRNPLPEPGEYFEQLVRIVDPTRSVSKTHLEFGQEGGAFWLRDRYSGNGTVVREPDARAVRCDPGKRYRLVRGTRVDIGEQFFIIS